MKIDTEDWKCFNIEDIFSTVERGNRLKKTDRVVGNTALVTAGFENYGIAEYVDETQTENKLYKETCITADMFGNVFFRDTPFICDDNVLIFINDKSKEVNLFIASVFRAWNKGKYSYTNQFRLKKLKEVKLYLPVTIDGNPDWIKMETYIQELKVQTKNQLRTLNDFFR